MLSRLPGFLHRFRVWLATGGLVVAAWAAFGFLLVPRLATGFLQDLVRDDYGRQLAIGEARFNPFTLTLELGQVALPDEAPTDPPLLAFERLLVDLDLASIWRRAFSFGRIALDGLKVRAVIRPGGALNLADLATASEPDETDAALTPIHVDDLAITGGEIHFEDRDRPRPRIVDLRPLSFRLSNFSTHTTSDDQYALDARLFETARLQWRGTLRAQPFTSSGEFSLTGLPLPQVAGFLGDTLPAEVSSGQLGISGRYRFDPNGDKVVFDVEEGAVTASELGLRARNGDLDLVFLTELALRGLQVSLAGKDVSVESVVVDGGRVQAWLEPDGRLNLQALAGSSPDPATTPTEPPPDTRPGWQARVGSVELRDLAVGLEDRSLSPAAALVLQPLNLSLKGVDTRPGSTLELALDATLNATGKLSVRSTVVPEGPKAEGEIRLDDFDLLATQPYLARQTSATLTSGRLGVAGRFSWADDSLTFDGDATVGNLRLEDNVLGEDFVKWAQLGLSGVEYRSAPQRLRIRTVDARSPFARIIIGPEGTTNIDAILSAPGAVATTAPGPTLEPAPDADGKPAPIVNPEAGAEKDVTPFPVRIDLVRVTDGATRFADFTTRPNFSIGIEKLKGTIKGLSSVQSARAEVTLDGQVDRFAPVTVRGQVNPLAAESFLDLDMSFRNVELASFTPYSGRFAGYMIRQGKLTADLNYQINDRKLDADHRFVINQLELGDKVESPDAIGLPLKLAIALLKDRNGVIDLDLPVTGDLDDPKFRVGPIVWKVLVNLLTKAVTAPFALLGSLFGGGEEVNLIDFPPGSAELDAADRGKLGSIVKALTDRPGLELSVPAVYNRETDGPLLAAQRLERELLAARRTELASKRQSSDGLTIAVLRADPKGHQRALETVWRKQAGKEAPLPPVAEGADPIATLEAALRERLVAGEAEYFELAKARADAAQAVLLTETAIDPVRVFLTTPTDSRSAAGGVVMELALR